MQCHNVSSQSMDELHLDQPELIGTNTAIEARPRRWRSGSQPARVRRVRPTLRPLTAYVDTPEQPPNWLCRRPEFYSSTERRLSGGQYSPSSSRFHHAPVWLFSLISVK